MQIKSTVTTYDELALLLYKNGCFRFDLKQGYLLKSGAYSPIYINLRTPDNPKSGNLKSELVSEIGWHLYNLAQMHKITFDAIAGLPHAGEPIADALSAAYTAMGRAIPRIRLVKEGVGDNRRIARIANSGGCREGMNVLVIDDVVTSALTKKEGCGVLKKSGFKVSDILVIIDRDEGGKEELVKSGYRITSLFTLPILLQLYKSKGLINEAEYGLLTRLTKSV